MNKFTTIPLLLEHVCHQYKELDLFVLFDAENKTTAEKIHYQEFPHLVKNFQSFLPNKSTRIVIYLNSGPEWLKVFFAIVCSGSVAVLIDANLEPDNVLLQIKQSEASLLITDNKRLRKIETVNLSNQLPPILNIENMLLADTKPVISDFPNDIYPTSLAAIVYTSGSTGTPKGIMLSHQAFCLSAASIPVLRHFPNRLNSFVVLPLWHVLGLANCILSMMIKGCSLYFITTLSPNLLFSTLRECQINHITTTPIFCETIYKKILLEINKLIWYKKFSIKISHSFCQILLRFSQKTTYYLAQFLFKPLRTKISPDFNFILSGGARLNPEIIKSLLSYGYVVMQGYGLSELCGGIACTHPFTFKDNCVGDISAWCEFKISDKDQHGIGEIWLKTNQIMDGYLNQPDLTQSVYTEDGWFKTGDLGYIDKKMRLYISGRSKDMIVTSGGKNISPDDVEHYFSHLTKVDELCVYGHETENGEEIVLVVKPNPILQTKDEIAVFLESIKVKNATLPTYYQARHILLAEEHLPRTPAKKIDRKKVKEQFSVNTNKMQTIEEFIKPNSELEGQVCKIYAEVLGVNSNKIGVHDSFFKLGGNSLLAMELKNKINNLTEFKDVSIADIFKFETVQRLINRKHLTENAFFYKLQNHTLHSNHEIAIIGMSGAFSGVNSAAELWQILEAQQEGIKRYTLEECRSFGVAEEILLNPDYIPRSGMVSNMDLFDPAFWDISVSEAKHMDPQIRKFIEHCWHVLEQSGYIKKRQELNIGVFAGSGYNYYFSENILPGKDTEHLNLWDTYLANSKDAIATKAAYFLGLTGPANSINTACSTGLVTVIEACRHLQCGTCNMALAGSVSLRTPDKTGYIYQEGMIESKDGYCRTFDKDSSGTIDGSGVGVVLLKRIDEAIRDKDNIIAVLRGYATNNDGNRKTSYTAPSVIGQSECILNAQRMAGITADAVDYVECHGTGTNLGDPIEIQALKEAFAANSDKEKLAKKKCYLGAVKANIGHTDSAAGIAGLIKTCLMLQHNIIPGQVNFKEVNPELHLEQTNFSIATKNMKWSNKGVEENNLPINNQEEEIISKNRIAGVSAFGIGGTNAHVILSNYIVPERNNTISVEISVNIQQKKQESAQVMPEYVQNFIFPVSAKSSKSIEQYKLELINYLKNNQEDNLESIAYTLQQHREEFDYRVALCAKNNNELIAKLKQGVYVEQIVTRTSSDIAKLIFMFPGQGAQYVNMALELYNNDELFRNTVDKCIGLANKYLEIDLAEIMFTRMDPCVVQNDNDVKRSIDNDINQTKWSQIALFIVSYSLAKRLDEMGIQADGYIGHSIGEYVAAALCGVFELEDAIKLVIVRGKLMQGMLPGRMLSIQATFAEIEEEVKQCDCELAVINAIDNCVVSGTKESISQLHESLDKKEIASVILNTSHAYHSKMMEDAANKFINEFKNISLNTPQQQFISNLSGDFADDEVTEARYWSQQLRNKVEFNKGVEILCATFNNNVIFIEVGPGKGLSSFVARHKDQNNKAIKSIQLLPSLKEFRENELTLSSKNDIAAILWMNGVQIDFNEYNQFVNKKVVAELPCYQFDSKPCWIKKQNTGLKTNNPEFVLDKAHSVAAIKILEETYTDLEYDVAQIFCDVLDINEISLNDLFFKIGGTSILAIKLKNKLNKLPEFRKLSVAELFNLDTVNKLSSYANIAPRINNEMLISTVTESANREYELSFAQERLWFIEKYENGSTVYNIPFLAQITAEVSLNLLEKAIQATVLRHEVLHSLIKTNANGVGYQEICDLVTIPLVINHYKVKSKDELDKYISQEVNHIYSLDKEYPIRISIINEVDEGDKARVQKNIEESNNNYICMVIHHIAFDGWSSDVVLRDVQAYYNHYDAQNSGTDSTLNLPELTIQYKDFASWQRKYLSGALLIKQLNYWSNKLDGYEALNLPLDYPRPARSSYLGSDVKFSIDEETSNNLRRLAKNLNVSLYSVLLSGYYLLLSSYSNQEDITLGTPIANRHYEQLENLVGFFVNTLALRILINKDAIVTNYIKKIGESVIEAQLYQDLPFEKLVTELNVPQDGSRHPIFQVMFSLQSFGQVNAHINTLFKISSHEAMHQNAQFDLTTMLDDSEIKISGVFNYAVMLFEKETILHIINTYKHILSQVAKLDSTSTHKIKELSLLNVNDYRKIIYDWNKTDTASFEHKTIDKAILVKQIEQEDTLFSYYENKVISKHLLKNIAIIDYSDYEDNQCQHSYSKLLHESELMAKYLYHFHLNKKSELNFEISNHLIAILSEKGYNQVIATLSIMKSGCAYLPLNIDWPLDRIEEIMFQGNVNLILISRSQCNFKDYWKKLSSKYELVVIEDLLLKISVEYKPNNKFRTIKLPQVKADDIAYVIFTSGSTGKPKGVTISHRGALNTISAVNNKFKVTEKDSILALSELSFDLSVYDIFGLLATGGTIIFPKQIKEPRNWLELIYKHKITIWNTVPQLAMLLIDAVNRTDRSISLKSLRLFLLSGDWIPLNLAGDIKKQCNAARVISLGGATEGSIWSIWYEINKVNQTWSSIPYGRAMPNQYIYILNNELQAVPIGVKGEIYIGGIGVALNYYGDKEKTNSSFISHPKLGRIYKTGDLGKWNKLGYIEFQGRKDDQVKVSGYRIELGEIENILSSYPEIKQVTVLAVEHKPNDQIESLNSNAGGNKYLVGYYVSESKLDEVEILKYLSFKLPEYMMPSILVWLEKLPLTINGKLDRKALPDPKFSSNKSYISPRNEIEKKICEIFAETLSIAVDKVGITDDFFRLGGNSIMAIKVAHQLSEALATHIAVADIFKYKNIVALLEHIIQEGENQIVIPKMSLERYPLSFAQERLWFIEQYEEGSNAYHIPLFLLLNCLIDIASFKKAIQLVIKRHEVLRSVFRRDENGVDYQDVLTDPLEIKEYSFKDKNSLYNQVRIDINRIFDLKNNYPIKVCIYELSETPAQTSGNLQVNTEYTNNALRENNRELNNDKLIIKKLNEDKIYNTKEYYALINIHHIASDGWSIEILQKEIAQYYEYCNEGKNLDIAPLDIQYKDFASWQRRYLSGTKLEQQLNYWRTKLEGYESLNLPTDKIRPSQTDYRGDYFFFEIDETIFNQLRQISQSYGVTLYATLLTGFYILLNKYSSQTDIVIGTPIANRHYSQLKDLIGFFVNSLALREKINTDFTGEELLKQVHNNFIDAQRHQDLPFEKIVEELKVVKDTSRHPIFQVMFGVQSFGNQKTNGSNYFSYKNKVVADSYKIAKYDLSLFIDDSDSRLRCALTYATSLYNPKSLERFATHYGVVLKLLSESFSQRKIKDYNILTKEEYQQIVYTWNETDKAYPENKTIHQLFEEQVASTPQNIAVVYKDTKLTYKELNQRANQLANYLRTTYQIEDNSLIALYLDRSAYMLIAILAILKSGGAYVPMDPSYPDERIQYILEDTMAKVVLTNEIYQEKLKNIIVNHPSNQLLHSNADFILTTNSKNKSNLTIVSNPEVVITPPITEPVGIDNCNAKLDQMTETSEVTTVILDNVGINKHIICEICAIDTVPFQAKLKEQSSTNVLQNITSNNLAYVIYTSGTTGRPKGVMIEQNSVINYLNNVQQKIFNGVGKNVDFSTNIGFDLSVTTTLVAFCTGCTICIYAGDIKDLESYKEHLLNNEINIIKLVPSYFALLSEVLSETKINQVILGGEKVSKDILEKIDKVDLMIYDEYGPTETTVGACISCIYKDGRSNNLLTIGSPYNNYKCYVLDSRLNPLPIGAIGELYIGGVGLARGYLNRAELTVERFISNPFQNKAEKEKNKNTRLYKTGDLVRYLPDGNLEYIGRNDFQVKIRGYRIELGEIESKLLEHNDITSSVVLVKKNETSAQLLAYIVPKDFTLSSTEIRKFLEKRLPHYMIPDKYIILEKLPLTINGKLDRTALPDPEFTFNESYIAPRNETEKKICEIFAETLSIAVDKVGITDDFFRLGGNSILAIKLVAKLNHYYTSCLKVANVFTANTVEKIKQKILQTQDNYQAIIKLSTTENKPNLFMFHPANAGCEIYEPLATKLKHKYSCYGIDNYNFYNELQIDNLKELASYYLEKIDGLRKTQKRIDEPYYLLGWSLGGQIALEIAVLLEQRSIHKIKVFLLDTVINNNDVYMMVNRKKIVDNETMKQSLYKYALKNNYDETYVNNVIRAYGAEATLASTNISNSLRFTSIILFKAMQKDDRFGYINKKNEEMKEHVQKLIYNNVNNVVTSINQINLIMLENAHHSNILECIVVDYSQEI